MFYSVKVCILKECVLFWLFSTNIEQIRSVLVCEMNRGNDTGF